MYKKAYFYSCASRFHGRHNFTGWHSPVPQPLVSAAVAAGAVAGAVGSGGAQTTGCWVAVCLMLGAASWGWTPAGKPPLKAATRGKRGKWGQHDEASNRKSCKLVIMSTFTGGRAFKWITVDQKYKNKWYISPCIRLSIHLSPSWMAFFPKIKVRLF